MVITHVHTDACPPDCEPTWTRRKRPDLDVHERFLAGTRVNGVDLPVVLWRVVTATSAGAVRVTHQPALFEVEADAVYHIEAELDQGAGLVSVHRLELGLSDREHLPYWVWVELTYQPPAQGRLVAKT